MQSFQLVNGIEDEVAPGGPKEPNRAGWEAKDAVCRNQY